MRTVTPFVVGTTSVKTGKFVVLNAVGAILWAVVIGWGGYFFGTALRGVITDIEHYEVEAIIAIAGLAVWIVHFYRERRHGR